MTIQDVFEKGFASGLGKNPELAKEVNAIIHFDITGDGGGQWTLDLTLPTDYVKPGFVGTSAMTLSATASDFLDIVSGKLNGQMAVMTGKLKIKPMNVGLAMKLGKVLAAGKGS